MMNHTDRHFRYFMRGISTQATLYTEMVVDSTILYGDPTRILGFHPSERPLVLQLASNDPSTLKEAIAIAEDFPYDAYNLNIGCPSSKVQHRNIGVCLMRDPPHVAKLLETMCESSKKPSTVKHRIGIGGKESYADLKEFVRIVQATGVRTCIVHARIALLEGLSPKQNRIVPPLRYEDVYQLKQDFPDMHIEINGGISSLQEVATHLDHVDSVMIGRAAYRDPMFIAELESTLFKSPPPSRSLIAGRFCEYIAHIAAQAPPSSLRHMMGLFYNASGATRWRSALSSRHSSLSEICQLADELSAPCPAPPTLRIDKL